MKRNFLILLCALGALATERLYAAAGKPNIVMLFIDDWAWNGSPVPGQRRCRFFHLFSSTQI